MAVKDAAPRGAVACILATLGFDKKYEHPSNKIYLLGRPQNTMIVSGREKFGGPESGPPSAILSGNVNPCDANTLGFSEIRLGRNPRMQENGAECPDMKNGLWCNYVLKENATSYVSSCKPQNLVSTITNPFVLFNKFCDIIFSNFFYPQVSSLHCTITRTDQGFFLTDKSSNGLVRNSEFIQKHSQVPLKTGDQIAFGCPPGVDTECVRFMFLILDDSNGDDQEEKITDRYNLSNEIGKGNFAVVYLGKTKKVFLYFEKNSR